MQSSIRFFKLENDLREIETSSNYFASFYLKMCFEETSHYKIIVNFCGYLPRRLIQIDVSFSCVCPVIDHEFRHHIVKVAVDPRGDSRVDPQTTLTMLGRNSFSVTGETHEKLTAICFSR